MIRPSTIEGYHEAQDAPSRAVMEHLRETIDQALPDAESKIWHGHPVWFLDGNPIVGYSRLKDGVRLLFWSGQSFASEGLEASGTFKAAERRYADVDAIDAERLCAWLEESRTTQWDYKNIVKRRGRLERLC